MASTSGAGKACGGCSQLRQKCEKPDPERNIESCVLRPCLEALWTDNLVAQRHATKLLADYFTRGKLFEWLKKKPVNERPDYFVNLLLTLHRMFDNEAQRSEMQALMLQAAKGLTSKFCTESCPPLFTARAKERTLCVVCRLATQLVEDFMENTERDGDDKQGHRTASSSQFNGVVEMASTSGAGKACGGCSKLRQKCEKPDPERNIESCVLRPCVEALWTDNLVAQGVATKLLADHFTRGNLLEWLKKKPVNKRPDYFVNLLRTAHSMIDDKAQRSAVQALMLEAAQGNASKFCTESCPPLFTARAKERTLCEVCRLAAELVEGFMEKTERDADDREGYHLPQLQQLLELSQPGSPCRVSRFLDSKRNKRAFAQRGSKHLAKRQNTFTQPTTVERISKQLSY